MCCLRQGRGAQPGEGVGAYCAGRPTQRVGSKQGLGQGLQQPHSVCTLTRSASDPPEVGYYLQVRRAQPGEGIAACHAGQPAQRVRIRQGLGQGLQRSRLQRGWHALPPAAAAAEQASAVVASATVAGAALTLLATVNELLIRAVSGWMGLCVISRTCACEVLMQALNI